MLNQLIIESDTKKKELELLLKEINTISKEKILGIQKTQAQFIDPCYEKVYKCSDQGISISAISQETGLEKGEIELILNLRRLPNIKT